MGRCGQKWLAILKGLAGDWVPAQGAGSEVVLGCEPTTGKAGVEPRPHAVSERGQATAPTCLLCCSFWLFFTSFHPATPHHPTSPPGLLITEHVANDQYSGPVSMMNEQLKLHKQLHQMFPVQPWPCFCAWLLSQTAGPFRRTEAPFLDLHFQESTGPMQSHLSWVSWQSKPVHNRSVPSDRLC